MPNKNESREESKVRGRITKGKVEELRRQHPEWSYAQIGREIGVSREMVRRIITGKRKGREG